MNPKCGHAKNENFHNNCPLIVESSGQVVENKKKLVQFVTIFNLLSRCKPMIGYEDF